MSVEALWTVEYDVAGEWRNGGVMVLEMNRVFGGDTQYYYRGRYSVAWAKGEMEADVTVTHYHGERATPWGDDATAAMVKLWGKFDEAQITGRMIRPGFKQLPFRMTKRASLP